MIQRNGKNFYINLEEDWYIGVVVIIFFWFMFNGDHDDKEKMAKIQQCTEISKAAIAASQPLPSCIRN